MMKEATSIQQLEQDIRKIQERNTKVEADKAWETSTERKILIVVFSYAIMVGVMYALGIENPFISAIIPACGYFISTLTL
ncbi:MAG: hypothetical protein H6767_01965 [Candidatus Peribacteria bacterium]|nr:MAG: hypothetical protein H6767_01965 [Candidatus Peribacteria bacterium]